jgi:hypothetical protein
VRRLIVIVILILIEIGDSGRCFSAIAEAEPDSSEG